MSRKKALKEARRLLVSVSFNAQKKQQYVGLFRVLVDFVLVLVLGSIGFVLRE
jgi:hypothetical protein